MAVVDLPDPTQPTPAVNNGSTDDLLSQLAGDEIDRMLAESDARGEGSSLRTPADHLPGKIGVAPSSDAPAPASPPSIDAPAQKPVASPANIASVLDSLSAAVDRIDSTAATPLPSASAMESTATSASTPVTSEPLDSASIVAAELEASEAERTALRGITTPPASMHDAIIPEALDVGEDAEPAALPAILRPLEWLNAPFASTADETRETIGKVALITLVNAVGILTYVFFFRRR